jgi:hypothetical protein
MTYDLHRLRLNGLIRRIEQTHTYVLTAEDTPQPGLPAQFGPAAA